MPFVSAQDARVAIGLLNASGYTTNYSVNESMAALDVSTLADKAKAFIVGQQWGDASLDMILDTVGSANGQFDVFHDWKAAASSPVTFGPEGFAVGDPVILFDALETSIGTSAAVADVVKASLAAITTGTFDHGFSVEDFTAITVDTNGAAFDGGAGAASTNGGVAHLHVSAFSGLTSDVLILEHSTTGVGSWTTIGTFTTVTGITSQRLVVAPGTSVSRYLRVSDDVTGSGSITRQVSFARR